MPIQPAFADVDPWPDNASAPAPKGHNKPPLEETIPLDFMEALLSDRPDFLAKLDDLLGTDDASGSVDRATCTDDDSLAKCGSLINTLSFCIKHVDAKHVEIKAPFLLGGRLADGQKNTFNARILAGKQKVEAKQQAYSRERQRIANEERAKAEAGRQRIEAERRKLEELARANNIEPAALPPMPEPEPIAEPERLKVRSDDGATVSTSVVNVPVVDDYAKAFRHVKNDAKVREAIDAAIARLVKATKATELTGVVFHEEIKINNR